MKHRKELARIDLTLTGETRSALLRRAAGSPGPLSRRRFLERAALAGGLAALPLEIGACGGKSRDSGDGDAGPLLFVSIDALHPEYLNLDSRGRRGGRDGDWLMPEVRRFLDEACLFSDARCYLPAATDMNHLNALAGTSSAQHGVLGVSIQFWNWNPDGTAKPGTPHVSWVRDDQGRPVDTVFRAWKRKWPSSRTAFMSGKFWVAEMYRDPSSGIDLLLSGREHPEYVPPPEKRSFFDPPGDPDAACDSESPIQSATSAIFLERDPGDFPSDEWIVGASLAVLEREAPDLALILLAQMDDSQHALGTAWDPDEFDDRILGYTPPPECEAEASDDWQLVSRRNRRVFREAVLDSVRDIDAQFGRLIRGIRALDRYRNATIVLYSDHSQITHLLQRNWLPRDYIENSTDVTYILHREGVISDEEKDGVGYAAYAGTSMGEIYFRASSIEERRARARQAKDVLLRHQVENHSTGNVECPWEILDHDGMIHGVPGVAEPGELWHEYFGPRNDPDLPLWPDLIVLMKNGWQAPVYAGLVANLGIELPPGTPPLTLLLGGHGAPDTQEIVMALAGPGIAKGRVLTDPAHEKNYRISDLAMTATSIFGLEIQSTTVGQDRSHELLP